ERGGDLRRHRLGGFDDPAHRAHAGGAELRTPAASRHVAWRDLHACSRHPRAQPRTRRDTDRHTHRGARCPVLPVAAGATPAQLELNMRLAARDLDIGYRGHVVGRGITLEVSPGEVLCLLGPNGAGETTLFRTLLGLLQPLGGSVFADELAVDRLKPIEIAKRMAYVPQAQVTEFAYRGP